jgi:hypothetical protein
MADWKIRQIFDMLNNSYSKYYTPSEHMTVDKVIVLFNVQVIFKPYIPKKKKCFGEKKNYKLCVWLHMIWTSI